MNNIHDFSKRVIYFHSGRHGAGGTTAADNLMETYGKDAVFISGGKKMRAMATKASMTLKNFIEVVTPEQELALDNYLIKKITRAYKAKKIIVLDSCIGHYLCEKAGVPSDKIFTVNLTCDPIIAGGRVYNARVKKTQNGRSGDSVLTTVQAVTDELLERTTLDNARYLDRYGIDVSNVVADEQIDTTNLDEIETFLEVFSAWVKACGKFIQTVNGPSQCGKTFTVSAAAKEFDTELIDSGIFYREAALVRILLGNMPVDKYFLTVLKSALFSPNHREKPLKLESTLQSSFISETVNFTSSEYEVRKLVALRQVKSIYLALLKANLVFLAGRDPFKLFKKTKCRHIWLENTNKRQIVLRAFAGKGNNNPSPQEVEDVLAKNLERDRADRERPHGSFKFIPEIMDFFDTKDLTKTEQVEKFCQLVRNNMSAN